MRYQTTRASLLLIGVLVLWGCKELAEPVLEHLGQPSLVSLLMEGKVEQAQKVLQEGADPNVLNEHGDSALIWATNLKHPGLVQALLDAGGQVNHKGSGGRTALHWACTRSENEVLRILIAAGATLDARDEQLETGLMKAARYNDFPAVSLLLKEGADPNLTDVDGKTALVKAIDEEAPNCVELLVLGGSNLDQQAKNGQSALTHAQALGRGHYFMTPTIEKKLPDLRKKMRGLLTLVDNRDLRPRYDLKKMEQHVHELVNLERAKHGLAPLAYDDRLSAIATEHSLDMNTRHFFGHENPDKDQPTDRARSAGYPIFGSSDGGTFKSGIGENIYQSSTYSSSSTSFEKSQKMVQYDWYSNDQLAQDCVQGWMDSPGHRANILNKSYVREGIGIAISTDEKVSITQNFW